MGFFGKLFEKKVCDLCGEEIGLLGNRKLEDGNCCKACAAKLSPWFNERRQSTVEEIRAQLEYREANREAVAAFHTTRTLGRGTKVLLDEDAGRFMVTSARNLEEANPDVLAFSQVTGCDLDVEENRSEITRQVKGEDGVTRRESYSPPRYEYKYDFYILIHVNNPYFDDMRFRLNTSSVEVAHARSRFDHMEGNTQPPTMAERHSDPDYAEYERLGQEIRDSLTQVREQVREEAAAASAPKQAVTCPWCGATTIPDASGCCEYCGGALNG